MSFEISFLQPEAARHAIRHVAPPFPHVLERMEREIEKEEQPAVGRAVGSLLRTLAAASQARRVLEVGTNIGYSALWLVAGMEADGHLDTIEMDEAIAKRAEDNFAAAGVAERVTVHRKRALDALSTLEGPYDLVFLDAAKAEYPTYLDHAARLLRPGGILAADNAFWTGRVWEDSPTQPDTLGILELTKRAFTEDTWATTLVPSEDGVLVAVKLAQGNG